MVASSVRLLAHQEAVDAALDRFVDRLMSPAVASLAKPRLGDILALEPAATALLDRAYQSHYCCDWWGPTGLEKHVQQLVGWHAANPLLRSSEAFDVLRDAALDSLLPELCQRCRCEEQFPEDSEYQQTCIEGDWE